MNFCRTLYAGVLAVAVVGCQPTGDRTHEPGSGRSANLAGELQMVARGKNQQIAYKADRAGVLYLYDVDTDQFLFTGSINAGAQFVLEPASNRATLNKQPLDLEHETNDRDQYKLYFVPK